jgi:uncharacterized protein
MLKKLGLFLLLALLPLSISLAYFDLGRPTGFVDDYTNTLSAEQKSVLESKLATFEKETSNEVFVVIIQNLQGDTVENFANTLFNNWGIGKKDKNNGILFLISLDEHRMRIEVGYGLEPYVTDAQAFQLIDKIAKPAFKGSDYYGGIYGVSDAIFGLIRGTYSVPSVDSNSNGGLDWDLVFFFGYIIIMFFGSFLAKSKSWWAGGVIGLILGIILGWINGLNFGIWSTAILLPIGLVFDFIVSRAQQQRRDSGSYPWWFGGGSGGFGGGFGGGGGGGSGGGGASGGW